MLSYQKIRKYAKPRNKSNAARIDTQKSPKEQKPFPKTIVRHYFWRRKPQCIHLPNRKRKNGRSKIRHHQQYPKSIGHRHSNLNQNRLKPQTHYGIPNLKRRNRKHRNFQKIRAIL